MLKIKTNNLANSGKYTLQLIYVFYIMNGIQSFDEDQMYELHFRCLEYHKYLFSNCTFIISADDKNNPLINEAKYRLNDIFYNANVQFIVEENHVEFREGEYYDKYVIQKLYNFKEYEHNENELTLFAHTKGVYNYADHRNTSTWVTSMYYFCLFEIDNISNHILYNDKLCYGFPCIDAIMGQDDANIVYIGSFQIFCFSKLKKYIDKYHINIYDRLLHHNIFSHLRWSAERFLSLLISDRNAFDYPFSWFLKPLCVDLYNAYDVYDNNVYLNKIVYDYLPYKQCNDFLNFHNEMTNGLNFTFN